MERTKYTREKQLREEAERERAELEQRLLQYQEEAHGAQEALRRSEETAELLAEKARVAEEEAMLLSQKAAEAEAEIQRIKISAIKTEEEKMLMERKAAEAELLASTMIEESERRAKEAEQLRDELFRAKLSERQAKEKLLDLLRGPTLSNHNQSNGTNIQIGSNYNPNQAMNGINCIENRTDEVNYYDNYSNSGINVMRDLNELRYNESNDQFGFHSTNLSNCSSGFPYHNQYQNGSSITVTTTSMPSSNRSHVSSILSSTSCDLLTDTDVEKLAFEIEKERVEYLEKSRHLQEQLRDLKSEIQVLKVEDKLTPLDRIYDENVNRGETKYSTLRRTRSGTTKARVAFFEEL